MALPVAVNLLKIFGCRSSENLMQRTVINHCRSVCISNCRTYSYKAALLKEINTPIEIDEFSTKKLKKNQIRIASKACAVNASDLLMCRGVSQIQPKLPFIPGYEVAGEVVEVSDELSKECKKGKVDDDDDDDNVPIKVGDRVIALSREVLGGFSEECVVDCKDVWVLPSSLTYSTAVALVDAYALALLGLFRRAKIRNSDYILVTAGAGGLGAAAVDIAANVYKCKVIGVCNTEASTEQLRSKGAWSAIKYSDKQLKSKVQEISGKHGADIVFETIGGEIFESAIHSVAPEGKVIIGGFASQRIPDLPMSELLMLPSFSLIGVSLRNYRETDFKVYRRIVSDVLELFNRGMLTPLISKTFKLSEVNDALTYVKDTEDIGKAVLVMDNK